jgi:hypothetical protein
VTTQQHTCGDCLFWVAAIVQCKGECAIRNLITKRCHPACPMHSERVQEDKEREANDAGDSEARIRLL